MHAIVAAIFWGLAYVAMEKILSRVGALSQMILHSTLRCAIYIPLISLIEGSKMRADLVILASDRTLWPWIAVLVLSFTMGDWLISTAVSQTNASIASIVEISYPLWTIVFAYFLLGRSSYDWKFIVGGFLIICGVVLVSRSQH